MPPWRKGRRVALRTLCPRDVQVRFLLGVPLKLETLEEIIIELQKYDEQPIVVMPDADSFDLLLLLTRSNKTIQISGFLLRENIDRQFGGLVREGVPLSELVDAFCTRAWTGRKIEQRPLEDERRLDL